MSKKNGGGAKGKFTEWLTDEGLLKIEGWARDGLTDEQIAKNIGISTATLYNWKNKFLEILEALKKGKEVVDRQVESALLRRALGYQYDEVTRELSENPHTGEIELAVTKVVTKEVHPDTTAQIFSRKNRKPDAWRDTLLQQLQAEKLKAETDFAQMRAAKLRGDKKDTGLLDALVEGRKQYEQMKRGEADDEA